eukprot:365817-Chlamydomonas_euryale.AAC.16
MVPSGSGASLASLRCQAGPVPRSFFRTAFRTARLSNNRARGSVDAMETVRLPGTLDTLCPGGVGPVEIAREASWGKGWGVEAMPAAPRAGDAAESLDDPDHVEW